MYAQGAADLSASVGGCKTTGIFQPSNQEDRDVADRSETAVGKQESGNGTGSVAEDD